MLLKERLYDEIEDVIEQHDGKIDIEAINEMDFLEAVINEDLRIDGPVTTHFRRCSKDTEAS